MLKSRICPQIAVTRANISKLRPEEEMAQHWSEHRPEQHDTVLTINSSQQTQELEAAPMQTDLTQFDDPADMPSQLAQVAEAAALPESQLPTQPYEYPGEGDRAPSEETVPMNAVAMPGNAHNLQPTPQLQSSGSRWVRDPAGHLRLPTEEEMEWIQLYDEQREESQEAIAVQAELEDQLSAISAEREERARQERSADSNFEQEETDTDGS